MLTKKKTYHPFHDSPSLLLQFILSDFLLAYEDVKKLHHFSLEIKQHEQDTCSLALPLSQNLEHVLPNIVHLIGSPQKYMRLFESNSDDGSLAKLKHHATLLVQSCEELQAISFPLYRATNKLWLLGLQLLDLLQKLTAELLQGKPFAALSRNTKKDLLDFLCLSNKMFAASQRVWLLLTKAFVKFKKDENVLFSLLRSKAKLDLLFGEKILPKLLEKMFTRKTKSIKPFLIKKYGQRGFNHLFETIALTAEAAI